MRSFKGLSILPQSLSGFTQPAVKSSKKDANLSEVSIIDEQPQSELKDDEPINENNDIEDK